MSPATAKPQHSRTVVLGYRCLVALIACSLISLHARAADEILEIHNDTLTDYLATSASTEQNIWPLVLQRGTSIDGSARSGSPQGLAIAGGNGGGNYSGTSTLGGVVDLRTGNTAYSAVHLAMPAEVPWRVGISFNGVQHDGTSHHDSSGYQGNNWFQLSQPELVFYDDASDAADDILYLVYGAGAFAEFKRVNSSSNTFKGKNGAAGVIEYSSGSPDTFTYTDQRGWDMVFFGDNTSSDRADWQLWKIVDSGSNVAYAGHATTAPTAVTDGYNSDGTLSTAYDSAGRRFSYTYTSGNLTKVKAEVDDSGWSEVMRVDYAYHDGTDAHGSADDLKTATVVTKLSDGTTELERTTYFRYYKGTYHATNNPGHDHHLKYIVRAEGYRSYDWDQDSSLDDDTLTATDANLKPYSAAAFEYDTSYRVINAFFNGECGCSGSADGEYVISYASSGYTNDAGYDDEWATRVVINPPDGATNAAWITQYFDEAGQAISKVRTQNDPSGSAGDTWATKAVRDSSTGILTKIHSPANVTGYTHSTGSLTTGSTGRVTLFDRETSSVHTKGFLTSVRVQDGTGTAYYVSSQSYAGDAHADVMKKTIGDATVYRPNVLTTWNYHTATSSAANLENDTYGDKVDVAKSNISGLTASEGQNKPGAVPTDENGSGSQNETKYHYTDGRVDYVKSPDGIISYTEYTDGQVTRTIRDADTSTLTGVPSGFSSLGTELHYVTTMTYDDQARPDEATAPDGTVSKRYYTKLADGRFVTLSIPRVVSGSPDTFHGPVGYSVTNLAGRAEASGTISFSGGSTTTAISSWIDDADSDPIQAVDTGTLARFSTSVHDDTGGRLDESRAYYDIPGSGAGTEGTNYDATKFTYDDAGQRTKVEDATGTITHMNYDRLGRVTSTEIGTDDSGGGSDDMVTVSETTYDSGNDGGNSLVTKQTVHLDDSGTNKRETTFTYDYRGRRVVTVGPEAPYSVVKYDHSGKVVASGLYSSSSGLTASTDPTSTTSNRIALSETFYDANGRVYQTKRHKIDPSDGSSDDTLTSDTWYDEEGRTIKTVGSQVTKTFFDRLSRPTHQFVLQHDSDTTYAQAADVVGDTVLVENQTVYDNEDDTGLVLMRVSLSRDADDTATGALDTNADNDEYKVTENDLICRAQITGIWYDDNNRLTDTVRFGTYGGADFDRDNMSVPSRSDTALRTTTAYNDDGTVLSISDPMGTDGIETRFEYDDLGRRTLVIANYVNGTPSGATGDDDLHTRYEYDNGQQVKIWVDIDGDGTEDADDQVTEYVYGVTKGTSTGDSKIGSNRLLKKVIYPDVEGGETEADHRVSYAYNAQGQEIWKKDQAGNIFETVFSDGGRRTELDVTTLAGGFDGDVRSIEWAYDDMGRVETVTQYDATASGNVEDQVKYTYDDWGPIEKIEQDHDGTVGGGGDYEISFTYAKSTAGRQTIRRSGATLPGGESLTYVYDPGKDDDKISRVTDIKLGTTVIASYEYAGQANVVKTDLPEPDAYTKVYGSTAASYDNWDRFNRIITNQWVRDAGTAATFFDIRLTYDRNSNITRIEDTIHETYATTPKGLFDVKYTIDSINRLTESEYGHWNGFSITDKSRFADWTLDQLGNWDHARLDRDGDGTYTDTVQGQTDFDDDRTHNDFNELTARDIDNDSTDEWTLTYDKVGNLTDDGDSFEFVWDAFGRLRKLKNQSGDVISEYKYNGLNHRIYAIHDTDSDGSMGDETAEHYAYDDKWRMSAMFEDSDTDPTKQWVYHDAGLDGRGGSSYIDSVILRERDTTAPPNGTLDERVYICQNWRADVVARITDSGTMIEWAKYMPYGESFLVPVGDANSSGLINSTDQTEYINENVAGNTNPRIDLDLDGTSDSADWTIFSAAYFAAHNAGYAELSRDDTESRKGFAAYENDGNTTRFYHVRHRVYDNILGRWTRRDPLGFVDGMNTYGYVLQHPINSVDPLGLDHNDIVDDALDEFDDVEFDFVPVLTDGPRSHTPTTVRLGYYNNAPQPHPNAIWHPRYAWLTHARSASAGDRHLIVATDATLGHWQWTGSSWTWNRLGGLRYHPSVWRSHQMLSSSLLGIMTIRCSNNGTIRGRGPVPPLDRQIINRPPPFLASTLN